MREAARDFLVAIAFTGFLLGCTAIPDLYRWAQKKYREGK